MRWGPILLCGWPGLPGLWYRGQLSSLLVAVGFSILLNLALVSSFLWRWYLGGTFTAVAWPVIFLIWCTSAWVAYQRLTDVMSVPSSDKVADQDRPDTLFIQAQREYLRGHWEESESLLRRRITNAPRDVESRLLLVTLFRHTRRLDEARDQLSEMRRFDEALEWEFEADRERQLIELIEQHEAAERLADLNEESLEQVMPSNNDGMIQVNQTDESDLENERQAAA